MRGWFNKMPVGRHSAVRTMVRFNREVVELVVCHVGRGKGRSARDLEMVLLLHSKSLFSFTMTSSKFEHVSTNTEQQSETSTGYSDGELRRGTTLYQRPRVQPVRKMRHDVIFRTCVITMIHRNVQPHVSMKWQR